VKTIGEPIWVGQYRLTARVATGGMAEVYVGRHITPEGVFGPMVAVKRLLPHLVKDSAIVRMFLNEARITAQIQHPNVVKIHELGMVGDEPFIAMELLEGRTWAELRQRAAEDGRRMPVGVALTILTEACRGLDAAHRAVDENGQPLALVHRDFTPDNIHVGVKGDVKVIDFGIARTSSWGAGTEPGTLKGKFFYMSPEMITANPVDHRADIFAAGVMLYEQLCGRRPFTGTSVDEVVIRIAREEPAPPSTYDPAVPRALEAICLRALAKDPARRFQTLAEFVSAMEAVGGDSVLASTGQVAEYVTMLFPEKTDERRQTLRRAREADPSVPGGVANPTVSPSHGLAATVPSPNRAPTRHNTDVEPAVTEPNPMGRSVMVQPTAKRSSTAPAALIVVALATLGAAAWFFLRAPRLTPSELLARAEGTQGAERVKLLTALSSAPEATAEQLGRAAQLLVDEQQWDAALSATDAWLQREPKALEARLLEARAAIATRKGKRAESALKEAASLAPGDARPDALLAELRELQAEVGATIEAWSRAVAKDPGNARYLSRQGYWLSQAGRLDEAEAALNKASKKKASPETTAELGFVKYRQGKLDEALRLLRAAVKERPDLLEAQYYLGAVLYAKRDVAGARAAYLAADAVAGNDSRPLVGLCEMEQLEKSPELAAAQARLRERFPKDAEALLSRCAAASAP
jgi:serine/threonine protein kinase/Flp pilus assembly protein TadD